MYEQDSNKLPENERTKNPQPSFEESLATITDQFVDYNAAYQLYLQQMRAYFSKLFDLNTTHSVEKLVEEITRDIERMTQQREAEVEQRVLNSIENDCHLLELFFLAESNPEVAARITSITRLIDQLHRFLVLYFYDYPRFYEEDNDPWKDLFKESRARIIKLSLSENFKQELVEWAKVFVNNIASLNISQKYDTELVQKKELLTNHLEGKTVENQTNLNKPNLITDYLKFFPLLVTLVIDPEANVAIQNTEGSEFVKSRIQRLDHAWTLAQFEAIKATLGDKYHQQFATFPPTDDEIVQAALAYKSRDERAATEKSKVRAKEEFDGIPQTVSPQEIRNQAEEVYIGKRNIWVESQMRQLPELHFVQKFWLSLAAEGETLDPVSVGKSERYFSQNSIAFPLHEFSVSLGSGIKVEDQFAEVLVFSDNIAYLLNTSKGINFTQAPKLINNSMATEGRWFSLEKATKEDFERESSMTYTYQVPGECIVSEKQGIRKIKFLAHVMVKSFYQIVEIFESNPHKYEKILSNIETQLEIQVIEDENSEPDDSAYVERKLAGKVVRIE